LTYNSCLGLYRWDLFNILNEVSSLVKVPSSDLEVHKLFHIESLVLELQEVDRFVAVSGEEVQLLEEEIDVLFAPLVKVSLALHPVESQRFRLILQVDLVLRLSLFKAGTEALDHVLLRLR